MAYGILRIVKIKKASWGEIRGRLKHSFGEFEHRDGVQILTQNTKNADDAIAIYRQQLAEVTAEKKDAVGALEIVITSTANFLDEVQTANYLNDSCQWIQNTFGAKNIFGAVYHTDEKTPHIHFFVCPRETKNIKCKQTKTEREQNTQRTKRVVALNAKKWTGGKQRLRTLQDSFYADVSQKYGFDRGEPSEITKRTNQRPQLNFDRQKLDADRQNFDELVKKTAEKLAVKMLRDQYPDVVQNLYKDITIKMVDGLAADDQKLQNFLQQIEQRKQKIQQQKKSNTHER